MLKLQKGTMLKRFWTHISLAPIPESQTDLGLDIWVIASQTSQLLVLCSALALHLVSQPQSLGLMARDYVMGLSTSNLRRSATH